MPLNEMENDSNLPTHYTGQSPGGARTQAPPAATWPKHNGGSPEAEIDWRRWAYVIWRRKWWIVAATVIGTSLSVISARKHEPIYQARAMVWVEAPTQGGPIEVTNVFSPSGWVDLLRSYAVLDAVVHELQLYLRPENPTDRQLFDGFELTDEAIPGSYRLVVRLDHTYALYNGEGQLLEVAEPGAPLGATLGFTWTPPKQQLLPGREVAFGVRRPRTVADRLGRDLEVVMADPDEGNFIGLTYRGTDPVLVADQLNAILDHFVGMATELKRQKLRKLAGTLDEQLQLASGRLQHSEGQLESFRVRTITLPDDRSRVGPSPGGQGTEPVFDRYFSLHVERDAIRQDLNDLRSVLDGLEQTGTPDAMRLEAIPSVRTVSSLLAALEELGRKEVEHRTLLYRYTDEHAEVQRISRDLDALRGHTIPVLVAQLMDRLSARRAQLDGQIGVQTAELRRIPPRAIEESRLRREFALAEQLYNSLQVRYKEAQVAEAATQPNIRILDRASPPAFPSENTALMRVVLGFVLSLGLALTGVIAHDRFVERRVQYPEQVVADLGLPILGVVPNLKALTAKVDDGELEDSPQAQSVVESFRALRTQLTRGLGIKFPAVIAITSPAMGDGKSLITSNLALAFAEPHRSTILIDGDVRRGKLHRIFGSSQRPGLAEYLRGDADAAVIIKPTDTEGFYFTPRGKYSEEVPELLDGEGMPTLLAQLKETFNVILIDTPPLAAGVDAVLIGAHADAVLAVIRKGRTDLDLARAKLDSYARMLGVPIVGAILNDVEEGGPYRYYTYSYDVYPYEPT